jgi:hypothetical protein
MADIRVVQIPLNDKGEADYEFAHLAFLDIERRKLDGFRLISEDVRKRNAFDGDVVLVQNLILIK